MKYVNKRMVIVINKISVELSGGTCASGNNIRAGLNLGFVEQIHANYLFGESIYPDIYHQAAAYMFYIIKNHVFLDGNKRTGLAVAIAFLEWNGILFSPLDEDRVFDFVISVAAGENDSQAVIPRISSWLRDMSVSMAEKP